MPFIGLDGKWKGHFDAGPRFVRLIDEKDRIVEACHQAKYSDLSATDVIPGFILRLADLDGRIGE